jgi:hypothetical protein
MKKRLTRQSFRRLSPAGKTVAYFRHANNEGFSCKNRTFGPSRLAQEAFVTNWQRAFHSFEQSLPSEKRW